MQGSNSFTSHFTGNFPICHPKGHQRKSLKTAVKTTQHQQASLCLNCVHKHVDKHKKLWQTRDKIKKSSPRLPHTQAQSQTHASPSWKSPAILCPLLCCGNVPAKALPKSPRKHSLSGCEAVVGSPQGAQDNHKQESGSNVSQIGQKDQVGRSHFFPDQEK